MSKEWTPVEEDLPEKGETVLVTVDHPIHGNIVTLSSRKYPAGFDEDKELEFAAERSNTGETVAWMPLPEPYEEE
jgi:hypothetical protein